MRLPARLPAAASGLALVAGLVLAPPAAAGEDPPGRTIVEHTVRSGDTATGLATRYRAWTRELVSLNGLGPQGRMRVGQTLRIPVVTAVAKRAARERRAARTKQSDRTRPRPRSRLATGHPSRERVRRTIVRTSRRLGVDPHLALAVAWQESGWQMQHTSSAGAIGAMQVLPDTGRWMSLYTGHRLRLRVLEDNVTAGVMLLRVLDEQTRSTRRQVAAYYQGLGAVRRHGLYDETRPYVRNVRAIQRRLERGEPPA